MRSCDFLKRIICILLIISLFALSSCGDKGKDDENDDGKDNGYVEDIDEIISEGDRDASYDPERSYIITLDGNNIEGECDYARLIDGELYLTRGGTYVISGSSSASINVDVPDEEKVRLVLDGLTLTTEDRAPIYCKSADKLTITLPEGSENKLEATGALNGYDTETDGAIYSKCDLTLNGSGSLSISAHEGRGISAKDELVIAGGSYTVTSSGHAIDANDSIAISSASLALDAGMDGLHAEHSTDVTLGFIFIDSASLSIEAEGDGISASAYVQIEGGELDILTGGGYENGETHTSGGFGGFGGGPGGRPGGYGGFGGTGSTTSSEDSTSIKGIKGGSGVMITDGSIKVNSADDTIHSNGSVTIKGGAMELLSGDDGVHADERLTITGGSILIEKSYEGLEALNIIIEGGSITLTADDDGLNAAGGVDSSGLGGPRPGEGFGSSSGSKGSISISGGDIKITASGDGIDANGTISISGGKTIVEGPTSGDTATLDYDVSATITGGVFIGTGAMGMAQTFSDSTQGVFAVSAGGISGGTELLLYDEAGELIISHTPSLSYQVIIISTPKIKSGSTYRIVIGEIEGSFEAA